METFLKILFFGLVPPLEGHTDAEKRWRLAVSFGLGIALVGLAVGGLVVADQNQKDYATNAQVAALRSEIAASGNVSTALILEMNIREFTKNQCAMRRANNPDASAVWAERLAETLTKYETLTGRRYVLMGCESM